MWPPSKYIQILSEDDVRIAGSRIGIEHLMTAYFSGASPQELVIEYPTLSLEDVQGVIAYCLENRDTFDAYMREWQESAAQVRRQQAAAPESDAIRRVRKILRDRAAG